MGKDKSIKTDILWRMGFVFMAFIAFGTLVLGRIVYLNMFKAEDLLKKSAVFSQKDIIIEPNRGDIRTEDGSLLATTLPKYEIRLDLKTPTITNQLFRDEVDSLAFYLSRLFKDKSQAKYKQDLVAARKQGNRYFLLKRDVSYPQLKSLSKFPILRMGKNKGGLIVLSNNKREKPFELLASRTIGFLIENEASDKVGFVGIERAFDHELRGEKGISLIRKISANRVMPVEQEVEPVDGSDVITTIDIRFQDIVESELHRAMELHAADYGTVILMEVETGKIKAIANLERNLRDEYGENYNHGIGTSIEPGSTFKLASLMVAMEDGFIKLGDTINVEGGRKKYYDRTMVDDHEGLDNLTVQQVLEQSSNVGVSKIIVEHYGKDPRRFVERLYKMNLNEKIGLEIKGEGVPIIKYPDDPSWSGVTLPWMSIGYEIHLTPLQVLNFYNAVANYGTMVKPYLVSEIQQYGKPVKQFKPQVINPSICSKETVRNMQTMLRGVVKYGTAKNINDDKLHISGKTGTAQIANRSSGYTSVTGRSYNVSFVGYFPSEKPKYSCIVVVNNPKQGGMYGSSVAAPIFKNIANKVYAMSIDIISPVNQVAAKTQIPYRLEGHKDDIDQIVNLTGFKFERQTQRSNWYKASPKENILLVSDRSMASSRVPDVMGLGLKDALFVLENAGLKVQIYGKGKVKRQSILAGQSFKKGERIVLEFSSLN
jgi:cell division protein FtsI (penicillin-binding protein 3)